MNGAEKRPRMTLHDVCVDMRSRGFPIKENTLSDAIAAGAFPFATLIGTGKTGRRSYMILRTNYEAWANENLGAVQS